MRKPFALVPVVALVVGAACAEQTTEPAGLDWIDGNRAVVTSSCAFADDGSTLTLQGDCTTDQTIIVPQDYTLDGNGYTITAVDPAGDHFRGAVVRNAGEWAAVVNLTVTTDGLANVCDAGDDRLRGIMFDGASGAITDNTVLGINQGASGCQEGNGIEVRAAPFDGNHPNTKTVDVGGNVVAAYQKTGIVGNGDVEVRIHNNQVGASSTQDNLAANSIQLGYGALGSVVRNQIEGNQWRGTSDYAGAAVLVYLAAAVDVSQNNIRGNSDIGLYIFAGNGTYDNNKVFDDGVDHPNSSYDVGVGNWGSGNVVTNNKVRGFDTPYANVGDGNNKTVPSPSGS